MEKVIYRETEKETEKVAVMSVINRDMGLLLNQSISSEAENVIDSDRAMIIDRDMTTKGSIPIVYKIFLSFLHIIVVSNFHINNIKHEIFQINLSTIR